MYKRLTLSLVLMGLAAFALTAGAFAWFSDSGSARVTIKAGTPQLTFEVRSECSGPWSPAYDFDTPANFDRWQGIVPGDQTSDCYRINNVGDGDLEVFVEHSDFHGSTAFRNSLAILYEVWDGTDWVAACGWDVPHGGAFTSERGCYLGALAEGRSMLVRASAVFQDTGGNQNSLQNATFDFLSTVTGYTG